MSIDVSTLLYEVAESSDKMGVDAAISQNIFVKPGDVLGQWKTLTNIPSDAPPSVKASNGVVESVAAREEFVQWIEAKIPAYCSYVQAINNKISNVEAMINGADKVLNEYKRARFNRGPNLSQIESVQYAVIREFSSLGSFMQIMYPKLETFAKAQMCRAVPCVDPICGRAHQYMKHWAICLHGGCDECATIKQTMRGHSRMCRYDGCTFFLCKMLKDEKKEEGIISRCGMREERRVERESRELRE